ncbi:MAG: hypothetical protein LQ341_007635, partial [Variospora aurantia]
MPPTPMSTLRDCTNCCIVEGPSQLQEALTKTMHLHNVAETHLILLFCGIVAFVMAAAAVATRLGYLVYRRLKVKRRRHSPGIMPCGRRAKRVRFAEAIENGAELRAPLVDGPCGDNKNYVWYTETDGEGLGIHFQDMGDDFTDRHNG